MDSAVALEVDEGLFDGESSVGATNKAGELFQFREPEGWVVWPTSFCSLAEIKHQNCLELEKGNVTRSI